MYAYRSSNRKSGRKTAAIKFGIMSERTTGLYNMVTQPSDSSLADEGWPCTSWVTTRSNVNHPAGRSKLSIDTQSLADSLPPINTPWTENRDIYVCCGQHA